MAIIINYVKRYDCAFMCNICGHVWVPDKGVHNTPDNPPTYCGNAKCKSRLWNRVPADIAGFQHGARIRRMRLYDGKKETRWLHSGPTYNLHNDTEEIIDELFEQPKIDPNVRYWIKCNWCNYIWKSRIYKDPKIKDGYLLPEHCPHCHHRIRKTAYQQRKIVDNHCHPRYDINNYCDGCKKTYPKSSGITRCEICHVKLRTKRRGKKGKQWDEVKYPEAIVYKK